MSVRSKVEYDRVAIECCPACYLGVFAELSLAESTSIFVWTPLRASGEQLEPIILRLGLTSRLSSLKYCAIW